MIKMNSDELKEGIAYIVSYRLVTSPAIGLGYSDPSFSMEGVLTKIEYPKFFFDKFVLSYLSKELGYLIEYSEYPIPGFGKVPYTTSDLDPLVTVKQIHRLID